MLFDPTLLTRHRPGPLDRGSRLRRWLARLLVLAVLTVGLGAALLLFGPLLERLAVS